MKKIFCVPSLIAAMIVLALLLVSCSGEQSGRGSGGEEVDEDQSSEAGSGEDQGSSGSGSDLQASLVPITHLTSTQ